MSRKILFYLFATLIAASSLAATQGGSKAPKGEKSTGERVSGKVETISVTTNTMSVRIGDATTTFSFDDKTVFTYGDHTGKPSDLSKGVEVFVTAHQGKVVKVNATQRIKGIIEQVDLVGKKLIVKIDDQVKEIPFAYFSVETLGGEVPFTDLKKGDIVFLHVNVGFASHPPTPKVISAEDR